jgi:hypothetical protein
MITRLRWRKDIESGNVELPLGLQSLMKADFDGDQIAQTASLLSANYKDIDDMVEAFSGASHHIKLNDDVAQAVAAYAKKTDTKHEDIYKGSDVAQKYMRSSSALRGLMSKTNREFLGPLSSAFTAVRNYMTATRGSDTLGPDQIIQQDIMDAIFSTIEQDVISTKKLEESEGDRYQGESSSKKIENYRSIVQRMIEGKGDY